MSENENKVSVVEYVVGFGSFIPALGVLLGLVSIILGALKFKTNGWRLMVLGVLGIGFSVGLYFWMYDEVLEKVPGHEKTFERIAEKNLKQTVMALEYYKLVHGAYPAQLSDLFEKKQFGSFGESYLYDTSGGLDMAKKLQPHQYELQPDGQHYYLYDVGPDEQAGTADDIFPDVPQEDLDHIGYRKKGS